MVRIKEQAEHACYCKSIRSRKIITVPKIILIIPCLQHLAEPCTLLLSIGGGYIDTKTSEEWRQGLLVGLRNHGRKSRSFLCFLILSLLSAPSSSLPCTATC